MRVRTWAVVVASSAVVATAAVMLHNWRTAGDAEVRAATERVADALARGDEESLAGEPVLQGRPDTVPWLMRHRPDFGGGCRVSVRRNGADGYQLMSLDLVSHLGVIETASGTVRLGFRYNPETGGLEFVTASCSSLKPQDVAVLVPRRP